MADVQLSGRSASVKSAYEANADTNAFTDAEKTKLGGIATGATANATDAALRDRATHTGAQAISTVTGLQTALDGKLAPDMGGVAVFDYTQPHVAGVSGTLTQAAHGGRACTLSGNVTVPRTDGFIAVLRNPLPTARTITPEAGNLIHNGAPVATLSLPQWREITVHGDGTQIWVSGAIA